MSATTAGGALGLVQEALMQRLAELRRHTHLRLCDSAQGQFDQELRGLEASVRAVEACVKGIKAHIASENSTIHKVTCLWQRVDRLGLLAWAATCHPSAPAWPDPLQLPTNAWLGAGNAGAKACGRLHAPPHPRTAPPCTI